jgi:hypothetical protein
MELYRNVIRASLLTLSLGLLLVGFGFWFRADWALGLWPWPEGPLSYLFIASIVLAEGVTMAWTAATMKLHAARGGALGFAAMNLGIAGYTLWLFNHQQEVLLLNWSLVCTLLSFGSILLFIIGGQYPRTRTQPSPQIVRQSFLVFSIALFIATAMLLARAPVVFPWPLKPDSSTMFGFLFLASAMYFFDGWLRPSLTNSYGQLIGFLVYDLVLIPPYLRHWEKAVGGFRISLVIYLIVLFWSAALASWFLWKYRVRPRPSLGGQAQRKGAGISSS